MQTLLYRHKPRLRCKCKGFLFGLFEEFLIQLQGYSKKTKQKNNFKLGVCIGTGIQQDFSKMPTTQNKHTKISAKYSITGKGKSIFLLYISSEICSHYTLDLVAYTGGYTVKRSILFIFLPQCFPPVVCSCSKEQKKYSFIY